MNSPSLVFTVHGSNAHTWWRRMANGDYPWWRRWSMFCCELREGFGQDCEVREFVWSGSNAHQARLEAGAALARAVQKARKAKPDRAIHVVGHSHGGNIALVSANQLDCGWIETLVLLASPHLYVRDRETATSRHVYWGEAEKRVGRIWNLYSLGDRVQTVWSRLLHGIPHVPRSRVTVMRTPQDCNEVSNGSIEWQNVKASHSAMHSSAMGRVVGSLLRGQSFPNAVAAASLSIDRPNPSSDRGAWPGVAKTQELIYRRGDARPFELGEASSDVGILLVHGFTASPAEMRPLADAIVRRTNWRCEALLLPGHGGRIEDMQKARGHDWIAAVEEGLEKLSQQHRHIFVCGVSMGAALACHAAIRRRSNSRLRGLILIAPAFGITLKRTIGLYLLQPFTNFRDKGKRAADYFLDHRLSSHLHTPLNLAKDVLKLGHEAAARLGELRQLPVLLFAGDLESTVSLKKIHAAAEANPWVRFIRLPKSRHILTVEPDREVLFEQSVGFVENCLK